MHEGPVTEGTVIDGKYRVERILGQGGMGVVVAARHLHLEQHVAIKFVLPEALENAEARERFAREARAAVRLKSEHVARVLDVGTMADGAPYMVMEYLEGSDLGMLVEVRGPLHPQEAVDYVLQASEAIAEAHACGIVHRDLKPRNLFVTTAVDGKPLVKVLDFGISKHNGPPGSASDLSLTKTSSVMGSPNYMSPEQLRSAKLVDARTDIWALGVILYETLTGHVPFVAETVTQLTAMVLQDAPRPMEQLRPEISAGLARVVYACLEKDPARRPQTVADLAKLLEPFGRTPGIAHRIAQVAQGQTLRSRGGESQPSGRIAVTGGTSVAWGETQLATAAKKRGAVALVAAGATLAVLAVGVTIGVRVMRTSAGGAGLETVPTVRQIDLAMPAPAPAPTASAVVALPPPAPSAAPSAAPVPIPPQAAPPTATLAPGPASPPRPHHGPTPPRPRPAPTDEMPSERN